MIQTKFTDYMFFVGTKDLKKKKRAKNVPKQQS